MALMKRQLHKQIIFRCNKPCQNNNEACVLTTDFIFRIHSFHNVQYDSFRRSDEEWKYNEILNIVFLFFKTILNKLYLMLNRARRIFKPGAQIEIIFNFQYRQEITLWYLQVMYGCLIPSKRRHPLFHIFSFFPLDII